MRVLVILSHDTETKELTVIVHALYFAQIREALRRSEEELRITEGATLRHLFTSLSEREPRLSGFADSLVFFLNAERATGDEILHEGDIVALCPPVSGG